MVGPIEFNEDMLYQLSYTLEPYFDSQPNVTGPSLISQLNYHPNTHRYSAIMVSEDRTRMEMFSFNIVEDNKLLIDDVTLDADDADYHFVCGFNKQEKFINR